MGPVCDEKFKRISEITNGEIRQCLRLHFQHHQLCNGAAHQLLRRSHHFIEQPIAKTAQVLDENQCVNLQFIYPPYGRLRICVLH